MKLNLYFGYLFYISNFHFITAETDNRIRAKKLWNYWSNIQSTSQQGSYGQQSSYPQHSLFPSRLGHYLFSQSYRDYYPISDCPTTDGNRTGICVANAVECIGRGGRPSGTCYVTQQSVINSPEVNIGSPSDQWQNTGIPVGICCLFQVTCGATILQNGTYFRNPNSPTSFADSRICSVTVQPLRRDICQLRLDFLVFDLWPPNAGNCDTDRFIISGQSQNNVIPALCGCNTGQHLYMEISNVYTPITLSILTFGKRNRSFDIRVTQISCLSPHKAPPNCLQYYTGVQGNFRSFNYELFNPSAAGYLNSLDYTICFRKEQGFCTITYVVPNRDLSDQQIPTINSNSQYLNHSIYFNITANSQEVGPEEAGAGPYECTDDYLILNNVRLCGSRLNAQLYPESPNPTINSEVFDNSSGPIFARFVTNQEDVSRGFNLNYRMNPCLINGK